MGSTPGIANVTILLLMLVPAGAALLTFGLRGRRVGVEPRCAKCCYDLTGLTSPRCPECGGTISDETLVYGVRRRSRPAIVAGTAMLALGLLVLVSPVYLRAKRVNKYPYYPFGWVLADAEAGTRRAADELMRRYRSDKVSPAQIKKLAVAGLRQQGGAAGTAATQSWIDILDLIASDGGLTNRQQQRYREQMLITTMQVRPRIRQGDELALRISNRSCGPASREIHCSMSVKELRLDGKVVAAHRGMGSFSFRGVRVQTSSGMSLALPSLAPGTYPLKCLLVQEFYDGSPQEPPEKEPIWSRQVTLEQEVEIVPADAAGIIAVMDDPSLRQLLHEMVGISAVRVHPSWRDGEVYVDVDVRMGGPDFGGSLPVGVAFDVFILVGAEERKVGSVTCGAGTSTTIVGTGASVPAFEEQEVTVILRASPEAARRTIDLFEISGGELNFGPLKVRRVGRQSAPPY